MGGKTRPPYAKEFREETVRLVRSSRRPIAEIARELGVSRESIKRWVRQADIDEGRRDDAPTTADREENAQLRRRVKVLETEREILKKAAAFFAQETNGTR
jgi:transposase